MLEPWHAGHQGIEKCKVLHLFGRHQQRPGRNCETLPDVPRTPKIQRKGNFDASRGTNKGMANTGTDLFYLNDNEYLIIADYYSKYPFVRKMPKTCTSHGVVAATKELLSEQGAPEKIISDNGRHCVNYRSFAETRGFDHITSSPHSPAAKRHF